MDAAKELRCFIHGWRAYMWLQATKEKLDDIRDAAKKGLAAGLPVDASFHGESLRQLEEQLNIDKATARLGFGNAISEIAANGCLGTGSLVETRRVSDYAEEVRVGPAWTRWLEERHADFNDAVNEGRTSDAYDILMKVSNKVAEAKERR